MRVRRLLILAGLLGALATLTSTPAPAVNLPPDRKSVM